MSFPETQRVIYDKNPLIEVICQLRFPPILRIDSDIPAAYQDSIRDQFPIFRENQPGVPDLPKEAVKLLGSDFIARIGSVVYDFFSVDEVWKVSLNREFIALTTYKYKRWEEFRSYLKKAVESVVNIYKPTFYTRIGLRYRDAINRSALGLPDVKWSVFLKPHIAGELSSPDIAENIMELKHDVVIRLEGDMVVHVQHGLAINKESNESLYIIDSDFYTNQKTEIDHAFQTLDHFNKQSARLFRWCITDKLHEAMGPKPI